MIQAIIQVKNFKDFIINSMVTLISFIFGYFNILVLDNQNLFVAIGVVVIIDWVFGVVNSIKNKNFETKKALKIVYYLFTYWLILFAVLSVEKSFPTAFWLCEAIIMPILVFQIISMIKNLILLGVINNSVAKEIFKNIDRYKDTVIENIDLEEDKIKE